MSYIEQVFKLEGRVVVITGGAGVLATAIGNGLAQAGCKLVILDLDKNKAAKRAGEITELGAEAIGLPANVLEEESLVKAKESIIEKYGRIDALINGAGGNMPGATIGPDQTFFDLKLDDLRKVMDLNFIGSVLPTMVFGKTMAEQGSGSILNISSMAAGPVITRVMGYSASKAGISNFTQWLATEMAIKFGEGIRVNAIAPGFFIGEQNRRLLTNEDGSYTSRGQDVIRKTPMRRFGKAEELTGAVMYLLSDAAVFVTGVVLPIDGGFSAYSGV
ncbi:MAG: SDR family oxidoreductase [Bacteroidetes bacterium]|jgi:NAD(P)-dependent dehydrogenase (short-subunit alcohol dehydrogenase family)|nr:SDR family oxidoreductase [Bacteroidota bacterium]MBT3749371.1 SDR family oxidoreductase [Bacteroidota bacterium]MBT4399472.1 SDR family oxidoreductase [Bacteroidota bacterium]MBT5427943.1 SDR family oxidoreductase [Bacteroidota bacterium]MBT7093322.1 SDR family oxidoreductase [Bacteroidota bacterium]